MNELEQQLRKAFARREAPEGFTERVMAETRRARPARGSGRGLRWAAAAVVAAMMIVGVWVDVNLNRRTRGERAKQDVLTALRVTSSALNTMSEQLRAARDRAAEPPGN